MKLAKSQSGFTPIHLLLLLVLIGIIGFAGWKVYDVDRTTKPADSSATPAPVTKTEDSKIPEGFVEYKNEELGFKFAYPKEWGSVSIKDTRFEKNDPGQRWQLVFSSEDKAFLGLTSKDWTTAHGRGGSCHATGGFQEIIRPKEQDTEHSIHKILIDRENLVAGTAADYGYCQGASVFAEYYFKNTTKYLGVLFTYTTDERASDQTYLSEVRKNEEKFIPAAAKDMLFKLANSFEEI